MKFDEFFDYHLNTKHSYFSVRNYPNRLSWENQPMVFKSYDSFEKYELNLDFINHSFLYYIAGLSAKKIYPNVEYYLRINPSAGALYPNEIYFQSRNNENIKDGIYHFDIKSSSITLLKEITNDGIEPLLNYKYKVNGFIFFISSLYFRSSWKYKNRAFRYCLLDSGHLLGTLEASSFLHDKKYKIIYDFDKKALNKLFNFSNEEFFQASVVVGSNSLEEVKQVCNLDLPKVDGTYYFEENELIQKAYEKSLSINQKHPQALNPNFFIIKRYLNKQFLKGVPLEILV